MYHKTFLLTFHKQYSTQLRNCKTINVSYPSNFYSHVAWAKKHILCGVALWRSLLHFVQMKHVSVQLSQQPQHHLQSSTYSSPTSNHSSKTSSAYRFRTTSRPLPLTILPWPHIPRPTTSMTFLLISHDSTISLMTSYSHTIIDLFCLYLRFPMLLPIQLDNLQSQIKYQSKYKQNKW